MLDDELRLGHMDGNNLLKIDRFGQTNLHFLKQSFLSLGRGEVLGNAFRPSQRLSTVAEGSNMIRVGARLQEERNLGNLLGRVEAVFQTDNLAEQPVCIVAVGFRNAATLVHIYKHIMGATPRGYRFSDLPLRMIVCTADRALFTEADSLLNNEAVPHAMVHVDGTDPQEIRQASTQVPGMKSAKTLYIRLFSEHSRKFEPPKRRFRSESAACAFAMSQLGGMVRLDERGVPIDPVDLFTSLQEHFDDLASVVRDSMGALIQEATCLDFSSLPYSLDVGTAFDDEIAGSLAGELRVPAHVFAMAAASAGLLPSTVQSLSVAPERSHAVEVVTEHLVSKPFTIRLAELEDLPSLIALEEMTWEKALRGGRENIRRRLETVPGGNLCAVMDGRVVGVLYTQRIDDEADVLRMTYQNVSAFHQPGGRLIQLIAISADPSLIGLNVGSELRAFALNLACLDPTVEAVWPSHLPGSLWAADVPAWRRIWRNTARARLRIRSWVFTPVSVRRYCAWFPDIDPRTFQTAAWASSLNTKLPTWIALVTPRQRKSQ